MNKVQGWVEDGNITVNISGFTYTSSNKVQGSFPGGTVTVYLAGTVTPASIYSDNNSSPTAKANPFTAANSGQWSFYAANGAYDIKFSGGGIGTPFTLGNIPVGLASAGIPATTFALLPTPKAQDAGNLALVTDAMGGFFVNDGTQWVRNGLFINVMDSPFGAKGDGTTDDFLAVQRAIDYMFTRASSITGAVSQYLTCLLYFPAGYKFKIGTSLNIQSFSYGGWGISGYGAVIIGADAGYPVFDALGASDAYFDRLTLVGNSTNIPWCGVSTGRLLGTQAPAGNHLFNRPGFDGYWGFRNAPGGGYTPNIAANDGACFFDSAGEGNTWMMPVAANKNPAVRRAFILDGAHHITPATRYTPSAWAPDTPDSCIQHKIINMNLNSSNNAPGEAVLLYAPFNQLDMDGYCTAVDECAIKVVGQNTGNIAGVRISVHVEMVPDYNVMIDTTPNPGSVTLSHWLIEDPAGGASCGIAMVGTKAGVTAAQFDDSVLNNGTSRFPAIVPTYAGNVVIGVGTRVNELLNQFSLATPIITAATISMAGRLQGSAAAALTAANDITIGTGNAITINGSAEIQRIATAGWQVGSVISLFFANAPKIKHGVATSGGFSLISLAGNADFNTVSGNSLTLCLVGTSWIEIGRRA